MAIKLTTNLDVRTALPIDTRFVLTKAQMLAMNEKLMPAVYFAICSEDSKLYVFDKTNTIDPTTGKFRIYESGGGSSIDTKYRIVSDGTNKWKLQQSTDDITWTDAEGSIDISETITYLQTQISTEITNRTSADAVLQTEIEAEAEARETKDTDLQEQIDAIPEQSEYSVIQVTPTPSGCTAAYSLTKDNVKTGAQINIPTPSVIKEVTVKVCTEDDKPIAGLKVGDKYIDFEWANGDHSYISVKELIVLYTAGVGISISDDNIISVKTDDSSIICTDADGKLSIKGYEDALQGYMLVKDMTQGLAWIKPLDSTQLDEAVAAATAKATEAGNYALAAGNSASEADTSAQTAARQVEVIQDWVAQKFWWGTISEYNALEALTEGTFYFVQLE